MSTCFECRMAAVTNERLESLLRNAYCTECNIDIIYEASKHFEPQNHTASAKSI